MKPSREQREHVEARNGAVAETPESSSGPEVTSPEQEHARLERLIVRIRKEGSED